MTKKADLNAEEWSTIAEGPPLAGMRVITASRGGTIRESVAMAQTYARARQQQGESELLDELVASPPSVDPEGVRSAGDIGRASTERLQAALAVLGEKASPEEVDAYRHFVLAVAEAAAEAHKEGGFMGVGGKQISEGERAALDEIATTLELGEGGVSRS